MRHFISALTDAAYKDYVGARPIFTLQLLSLTIVNEEGASMTLISDEFNPSNVSSAYLDAFLNEAGFLGDTAEGESKISQANAIQNLAGMSNHKIKKAIREFIGTGGYMYGYYPHADFVILKMLLGDLKEFYLHDLRQIDDYISSSINDDFWVGEDSRYPTPIWEGQIENSASKAKWCKSLYDFLMVFKNENNIK